MQSVEGSGVSVAKQGSEWKAACAADGWQATYKSQTASKYGIAAHKRGQAHKNGNGTQPQLGEAPKRIVASEDGSINSQFQDALLALSEAREAYERSLSAFLKMIGD